MSKKLKKRHKHVTSLEKSQPNVNLLNHDTFRTLFKINHVTLPGGLAS